MMTIKRANAIVKAILGLRDSITDEQAIEAAALYPEWKEEQNYVTGTRLLYKDTLYKVLQDHTSQANWTPDMAVSLFAKVLIPDENVIPDWEQPDSTNTYKKGDKVSHNGQVWVSDVDNNSWEPGVYGWTAITEVVG